MISSNNPAVSYHHSGLERMSLSAPRVTPDSADVVLVDTDDDSDGSFYTKKPRAVASVANEKQIDPITAQKRSNLNSRKTIVVPSVRTFDSLKRAIEYPSPKDNVPDLEMVQRSSDDEDDDDMISSDDPTPKVVAKPDMQPHRLSLQSASSVCETSPCETQQDESNSLTDPSVEVVATPTNNAVVDSESVVTESSKSDAVPSPPRTYRPSVSELVKTKARKCVPSAQLLNKFQKSKEPTVEMETSNTKESVETKTRNSESEILSELVKTKARKCVPNAQSLSKLQKKKKPTVDMDTSVASTNDVECSSDVSAPVERNDETSNKVCLKPSFNNSNGSIKNWKKMIAPVLQFCGVCAPCKEEPCGQCRLCIAMKGKLARSKPDGFPKVTTFSYCIFKCCVRHYKVQTSQTLAVMQWYRDELDFTRDCIEQQLTEQSKGHRFRFPVGMPVYCWWPDSQVRLCSISCLPCICNLTLSFSNVLFLFKEIL